MVTWPLPVDLAFLRAMLPKHASGHPPTQSRLSAEEAAMLPCESKRRAHKTVRGDLE